MAGFVSVSGSSRVGSVVARSLSCGFVWANRPLPSGGLKAGFSPAPSCLFVPFACSGSALAISLIIKNYGFSCSIRSGQSGSPVFSACGLPVPAFVLKIRLCSGWSSSRMAGLVLSVLSAGVVVLKQKKASKLSSLAFAL